MSRTCADDLIQRGPRNKGLSRALQVTEKGADPIARHSDFMLELAADIYTEFSRPRVRTWGYTAGGVMVETTVRT